jgi:hypothetical protein
MWIIARLCVGHGCGGRSTWWQQLSESSVQGEKSRGLRSNCSHSASTHDQNRGDWALRELRRVRATTSQSIQRRPVNHLHCSVLSLEGGGIRPSVCARTRSAQGIARARAQLKGSLSSCKRDWPCAAISSSWFQFESLWRLFLWWQVHIMFWTCPRSVSQLARGCAWLVSRGRLQIIQLHIFRWIE